MRTHYWICRGPFTPERFKRAVRDCIKVLKDDSFEDVLAGWDGFGKPIFSDVQICFNGVDEDSCDTFSVNQNCNKGLFSCQTNDLPYDFAVRCCLLILRHYLTEEIEISSDDRDGPAWAEAQQLVNKILKWNDEFVIDAIDVVDL